MNKTESDIMRIKAKWSHHQQYVRPKIIWWQEIKQRLYNSMEGYEHPFYKNIEGIREFIKPKRR
jgi:hypothetical protein